MKRKNNRKGFTIVELVITIAVIGVLTAILVPTFIGLTQKANEASDDSLVTNLNKALAIHEATPGDTKNNTPQDAIDDLFDEGYRADVLVTKSDKTLVWCDADNRFHLATETAVEKLPEGATEINCWGIYNSLPEQPRFSVYAGLGWTATSVEGLTVGFDAGTREDIASIAYSGTAGSNVSIRTNGGTLTINAPADTVKHFGNADKVDVKAVAGESYHEHGTVTVIAVKKGHVEVASNSDVKGIYVYNDTTYKADGSVDTADTSFESVKITVKSNDIPKLSRSAVTIQEEGTKVCTIVTDQAKDVYLFQEGIYEQIKAVPEGASQSEVAASPWIDQPAAEASANTQNAARQIANNFPGSVRPTWSAADDGARTYSTINNMEEIAESIAEEEAGEAWAEMTPAEKEAAKEAAQAVVANPETAITDGGMNPAKAEASSALDGSGTKLDPFMVYDFDTMQKVSEFYELGYNYFKVDLARTANGVIDCRNTWTPVNLNGSFDGQGVVFNNVNQQLFRSVGKAPSEETYTIKDITVNANINISGYGAAIIRQAGNNLTLDGVDVHGYIEGNNGAASYVCFGPGNITSASPDSYEKMNWVFKNCHSDATIVATGDVAVGFVKHPYCSASQHGGTASCIAECLITIEDSIFNGKLSAVNNSKTGSTYTCKYFVGNANDMLVKAIYSEEFLAEYGNPEGTLYATPTAKTDDGIFFIGNYPGEGKKVSGYTDYGICMDSYTGPRAVLTKTTGALPSKYDVFTVNKVSGAASAKVTLEIAPNGKNETGSYLGTYMSETLDISSVSGSFQTEEIRYFDVTVNGNSTTETGLSADGKTFNIVGSYFGTTHNGTTVRVTQYDANGNVINITTFAFPKA